MNEKQARRAQRFTNKVVKNFADLPIIFDVQATTLRGITVSAIAQDGELATMYINQQGEGSLRAPGMGAKERGKIRG
jgi:hypothetical protein